MSVKEEYHKVRKRTTTFCSKLDIEDYSIQVVEFASPAKWHLAHSTWFFETFVLIPNVSSYKVFDSNFNYLFNSYYNNAGDRIMQANRGNMSRPTIDRVYAYRDHVDAAMSILLEGTMDASLTGLITLGLNHEQQHQELLITDVKYMFGHNQLLPVFDADAHLVKDVNIHQNTVRVKAGIYEIGHGIEEFCYDNEQGVHKVYVDDFSINNFLVTNGDYLEFMQSGGYLDFNHWLDDGWTWVNKFDIKAPLYWHEIDGEWYYYTLSGLQKVQKDAILSHISYYEAHAYAEWRGYRLPTEFEWEIAASSMDWGKRWEWTNSSYLAYPDFQKANGAVGEYNGKFMSGKMVLRGASVATSPGHSRHTYRNFFSPGDRWQFTGLRLVK